MVDPPNYRANVALELDTGERYRFGATTIQQKVVDESLERRYLRYHEGEPFDLTQVLRTQFALDDAQYFANLEVQPGEPDRSALTVPVTGATSSVTAVTVPGNRFTLEGHDLSTGFASVLWCSRVFYGVPKLEMHF